MQAKHTNKPSTKKIQENHDAARSAVREALDHFRGAQLPVLRKRLQELEGMLGLLCGTIPNTLNEINADDLAHALGMMGRQVSDAVDQCEEIGENLRNIEHAAL